MNHDLFAGYETPQNVVNWSRQVGIRGLKMFEKAAEICIDWGRICRARRGLIKSEFIRRALRSVAGISQSLRCSRVIASATWQLCATRSRDLRFQIVTPRFIETSLIFVPSFAQSRNDGFREIIGGKKTRLFPPRAQTHPGNLGVPESFFCDGWNCKSFSSWMKLHGLS